MPERLGDNRGAGVLVGMVGPPGRRSVALLPPTSLSPRQVEEGTRGQEMEKAKLGS